MEKWKRKGQLFTCPQCGKNFSTKFNCQRHEAVVHEHKKINRKKESGVFICHKCGKQLSRRTILAHHVPKCTFKPAYDKPTVQCILCDYKNFRPQVLEHYQSQHNIIIETETLRFDNLSVFKEWKEELEKNDVSKYIRFTSRESTSSVFHYYRCHRDGNFKSSGKNIRNLKLKGSNKINGYCPSKMDVKLNKSSKELEVTYLKTHVGHERELEKIPISKEERDALAEKLRQKIPLDAILKDIRKNKGNRLERLHLLTKKDLYNIKALRNISIETRPKKRKQKKDTNDTNEIVKTEENVPYSDIEFQKSGKKRVRRRTSKSTEILETKVVENLEEDGKFWTLQPVEESQMYEVQIISENAHDEDEDVDDPAAICKNENENEKREEKIQLCVENQLASDQTSSSLFILENHKIALLEQFKAILEYVTNEDQCRFIETCLNSMEPHLTGFNYMKYQAANYNSSTIILKAPNDRCKIEGPTTREQSETGDKMPLGSYLF